jgi:hypothetical protein
MLLSYPVFVVEELLSITLTVIVTYAIVLRFELPVYYIIPIMAALNALSVVVQKQAHGPDTDDTILRFAAGTLLFTAGIIHLIILKMRFNWLETVGIVVTSGILAGLLNYLLL